MFLDEHPQHYDEVWKAIFPRNVKFWFAGAHENNAHLLCGEIIAGTKATSLHQHHSLRSIDPVLAPSFHSFVYNNLGLNESFDGTPTKPRILIINRRRNRVLPEEKLRKTLMTLVGCDVVVEEALFESRQQFTAQLELLQHFDIMILSHGAAMHNSFFLRDNSSMVEIIPHNWNHGYAKWMLEFYPNVNRATYRMSEKSTGFGAGFLDAVYDVDVERFGVFFDGVLKNWTQGKQTKLGESTTATASICPPGLSLKRSTG